MLVHPQFNPIALDLTGLGLPLQIHWYGLSYLAAFGFFLWLAGRRIRQPWLAEAGWHRQDVEDLLFYGVLGVVLGGRLGYVLFYKPEFYLAHPMEILAVWKGGMAFHGGLLGVAVALLCFAWQRQRRFLAVTDVVAPCVPIGYACGRLGNFINGELWGRPAPLDLPWAMVFPQAADGMARHPSPLYQLLVDGLLLFALMWWFARKQRPEGRVTALFLIGYGLCRFATEYFREPDGFLGLGAWGLSRGQWLCVPMVVGGALLWAWSARRAQAAQGAPA